MGAGRKPLLNAMHQRFLLALISLTILVTRGVAQNHHTAITRGENATHIVRITDDTLFVATGRTYAYTVDTPEDSGLVSTGIRAAQLPPQLRSRDGRVQTYRVLDRHGQVKQDADLATGDRLEVTAAGGKTRRRYTIVVTPMALSGQLHLGQNRRTIHTPGDLTLYFSAGQRSPDATVTIYLPPGISATMANTTVNVIGRGEVLLKDLSTQSTGRVGSRYSYAKVGAASIRKEAGGGSLLTLSHLDLRPANGWDLKILIRNVTLSRPGTYAFSARYTTTQPDTLSSAGAGSEEAVLTATPAVADLHRVVSKAPYQEMPGTYTSAIFRWSTRSLPAGTLLQQSLDGGKTWQPSTATLNASRGSATLTGLQPDTLYTFRLQVKEGVHQGYSNLAYCYTGKMDIKRFGVSGKEGDDHTEPINKAIAYLESIGGGTLKFSQGTYAVRTVNLKTNVWLYLERDATIKAIKGADAPETTWFSDRKYRSGLSPTDPGPYADPENYLTKQDVGHHYFRNTMFFGERLDNVKIIGTGRITGDGNLVTGDKVMNNAPDNRADKMFTFKLCTNIEIGGLSRAEDLWYDPATDEPYYTRADGSKDTSLDGMLHIDRAGHFVLLATGTDTIQVHNTYFGRHSTANARDIYDFMGCSQVTVTNIYSRVSSDDIVKPGSDCSLGFTRPARHYRVRNVIGDTNCNLFQIGSETADDIMDICVDNIYVLGANKAGFSISTNDGGHIRDIHLNCGHTGPVHARSKMYRTTTPFFISISNRARILGAEVGKYTFTENGKTRQELLVKNVSIGQVENIIINGVDIYEVYGGSAFGGQRWKAFDGSQRRATPIIAGYGLPSSDSVSGGLDFKLPNGLHTGYIRNIQFNDVHVLVKGGHPDSDSARNPPELGVGQYNVSNLGVQPSYGLWARHVKDLSVTNSSFHYEQRDNRYALYLDDVVGARIAGVKMVRPAGMDAVMNFKNSADVTVEGVIYYQDIWGHAPTELPRTRHSSGNSTVRTGIPQ